MALGALAWMAAAWFDIGQFGAWFGSWFGATPAWLIWPALVLFLVAIVALWCLNLIGLPGNWLIVLTCVVWLLVGPERFAFSWGLVVALAVLAAIGEAVEFAASVVTTQKQGGSKTGATCSLGGSMIGGLAGAILGLPIPVPLVGSVVGSILFACGGAWAGAVVGEHWAGRSWDEAIPIGNAAFVGRLLGTVGKFTLGSAMVGLALLGPLYF